MNKNILVSAGVALLVVILSFAFFGPSKETVREVVKETVKLGAFPGFELNTPARTGLSVNGLPVHYYSTDFNTASTTLCSFRGPENSTSTILVASAEITQSSSTALYLEWGHSAQFDATTTSLGIAIPGANAFGTILASTTDSVRDNPVDDTVVLAPNRYLNFKYGGNTCVAGSACTSLRGTCRGILIEN